MLSPHLIVTINILTTLAIMVETCTRVPYMAYDAVKVLTYLRGFFTRSSWMHRIFQNRSGMCIPLDLDESRINT